MIYCKYDIMYKNIPISLVSTLDKEDWEVIAKNTFRSPKNFKVVFTKGTTRQTSSLKDFLIALTNPDIKTTLLTAEEVAAAYNQEKGVNVTGEEVDSSFAQLKVPILILTPNLTMEFH